MALAPVPSKNITHMGTSIQVFKSLMAMTRIGIAIPGNGQAMSSIFSVCITNLRFKRGGGAYKRGCCNESE